MARHRPGSDAERLPRSLYVDTARAAVPTPPLDGDARVAVAVIGGGFTGLSAALHLAQRGIETAVVEARKPGWGASGRNGGQVNPGLKEEPAAIERAFGTDLGRRMVALSGGAPGRCSTSSSDTGSDATRCNRERSARPSRRRRPRRSAKRRRVGRIGGAR